MSAIQAESSKRTPDFAFSVVTFLLGQSVLAMIWVCVGLCGQLNVYVVVSVISIGFIIIAAHFKEYASSALDALKSEWHWLLHTDIAFRIICFSLLGLLGLFFLLALFTGPLGDAEAYYMAYPKVMAASGYLSEMPGIYSVFSQIGVLGELHFAALMTLGLDHVSKLFVWPIAVAAGFMLALICRQVGIGKRGQWFAFVLLFTSTGFTNHIWDGKVDVLPVALGLAAVYWIMAEQKLSIPTLRLIGLFSGFAMVAKFSYIPILMPSFFFLIAWRLYTVAEQPLNLRRYILKLAQYSLTLGLWALLAWMPHLIKNWMLFDAPLAPFIGMSAVLSQPWFSQEGTDWILKTYPLALVFGRYPGEGGNFSFLWLAFLPLIFFLPRAKSIVKSPLVQITAAGLVGVVIWMALRPSWIAPRYIFISLALVIPVVVWGAEQLYEKELRPYLLRSAMLISILFAIVFFSYPHIQNTMVKEIRSSTDATECELAGAYCNSFKKLNNIMPYGSRMYFAGYYGYWARADTLQCQLSFLEMQKLDQIKGRDNKWIYLVEQGVEYVVIDRFSHAKTVQELAFNPIPSWLTRDIIVESDGLVVMKIESANPNAMARVKCIKDGSNYWRVHE